MRITDVAGVGPAAELSDCLRELIETRDDTVLQCSSQQDLCLPASPGLCERGTWNDHVFACLNGELERGPHRALVAFECDQGTGVQDAGAHRVDREGSFVRLRQVFAAGRAGRAVNLRGRPRALAAASSSRWESSPCFASQSSITRIMPSARSLRRAASAIHVDNGWSLAASRKARASSVSREIAMRATVIPRYYGLDIASQGGPPTCVQAMGEGRERWRKRSGLAAEHLERWRVQRPHARQ